LQLLLGNVEGFLCCPRWALADVATELRVKRASETVASVVIPLAAAVGARLEGKLALLIERE